MESKNAMELLGVYEVSSLKDVQLIEPLIDVSPHELDISAFTQKYDSLSESNWQIAYDEHFLNEDGTKVLCKPLYDNFNIIQGSKTRIAFFLFFIDFNKPLSSQFGDMPLSNPTSMPDRLSQIVEFEPVE